MFSLVCLRCCAWCFFFVLVPEGAVAALALVEGRGWGMF